MQGEQVILVCSANKRRRNPKLKNKLKQKLKPIFEVEELEVQDNDGNPSEEDSSAAGCPAGQFCTHSLLHGPSQNEITENNVMDANHVLPTETDEPEEFTPSRAKAKVNKRHIKMVQARHAKQITGLPTVLLENFLCSKQEGAEKPFPDCLVNTSMNKLQGEFKKEVVLVEACACLERDCYSLYKITCTARAMLDAHGLWVLTLECDSCY